MKKFIKFLPVALAAFALASCSDDMMTSSTANADENALYFTMESINDGTRAGVVGNGEDKIADLKFRWTKGDQIRVYDNNLAMYDVYQYGGESFQAETPAAKFTPAAGFETEELKGKYSIAVFPNSGVEAVYLDKVDRKLKHFVMNVADEYAWESATADSKEAHRCDVPMYGVLNDGTVDGDLTNAITQMNFLTAWTRIYMRNLPKDIEYICVVSEDPNEPLTGQFEAKIKNPVKADDEPWLLKKDDVEETWGNIMFTKLPEVTAEVAKDGVCFPLLVQTYKKIHVFGLKKGVVADKDALRALANNMADYDGGKPGWNTLLGQNKAIEIASKNNLEIQRRRQCWTVRYTYTCYLDTKELDPFRPGEVSKLLAKYASNIIGPFRVVPIHSDYAYPDNVANAKTLVSGEGDYYTHRIQIPAISDLAEIVLDFRGAGIQYDEALQIFDASPELNQFAGKLTIYPGEIKGGSAKAKIEVNLPKAKVWVVGDGTHPIGNVDVQEAKEVHIGDGETATTQETTRTVVFKKGTLFIEDKAKINNVYAQTYAGDPSKFAEELVVQPGGYISENAYIQTKCNVTLNGAGYDVSTGTQYTGTQQDGCAEINKLNCEGVKAKITISSNGDSRIGSILAPTTGDKLNYLEIKTKLFQKSATDKTLKSRVVGYWDGANDAIYTGAQLVKLAEVGTDKPTLLFADAIDMNNVEWTGGEVSKSVYGINYNAANNRMNNLNTDAEKQVSTNSGKTIIKNLKLKKVTGSSNGLFATLTTAAPIAGFELNTVEFKENLESSAPLKYGALVGAVSAEATIDEITVTGLDFESEGASILGGLIGTTNNAVTIHDASVSGILKGRGFVGGLIGQTTSDYIINIYDSKTPSLDFDLKLIDGTSLAPTQVGTFGSFIGGATAAARIHIFDCNYGTAISKVDKGNGVSTQGLRFGAIGDEDTDEPFFGGNPWIGRFTGTLGTLDSKVSSTADKKNFIKFTYSGKYMERQGYIGNSAYEETTATLGSYIKYDGTDATTGNPNEGFCYGTNLYGTYNNADFGYDNAYKDAK